MRVCATSDFHGHLPEIPECDLLLICGDVCPATNHNVQFQLRWMRNEFSEWLTNTRNSTGCSSIVGICGNHDFVGQKFGECLMVLPWVFLSSSVSEVLGLKIWGCPYTREFYDWAFMMTRDELFEHHCNIPDCDIIVTHGPPYGFGDRVPRRDGTFENVGSEALLNHILAKEPKLVVFGHVHCDQGTRKLGNTIIANVSYVNGRYQPYYPPQVFDIEV